MTDYARGLKCNMKVSCLKKGGLPMVRTQTWRGDKSRANVESMWSGVLQHSLYARKLALSVTHRNAE